MPLLKAKPSLEKLKGIAKKTLPKLSAEAQEYNIGNAIQHYLRKCNAFRFLFWTDKRHLFYRPFLMVLGPEGSGKTSLFASAGISFAGHYPGVEEGYTAGESAQPPVVWYYADNAVWLDCPGNMLSEERKHILDSIAVQLGKVRPKRPVDGVIIAVSCEAFFTDGMDEIKDLADALRKTVISLIKQWEIDLPVHILFTHTDTLAGFEELFSDSSAGWEKCILGAQITDERLAEFPRNAFLLNFDNLTGYIEQIRVQMISRMADPVKRMALCQFPIVMNVLRDRLATFIASLLHESAYTGKPLLGGFYFTSIKSVEETPLQSDSTGNPLGALFNHPLNPHGRKVKKKNSSRQKFKTWFCRPLVTGTLPECALPANSTGNRYRRDLLSLSIRIGTAALIILAWFIILQRSVHSISSQEKHLRSVVDTGASFSEEGIDRLGQLLNEYDSLSRYRNKDLPLMARLLRYDPDRTFHTVENRLVATVQDVLLKPCMEAIEQKCRKENLRDIPFATLLNRLHVYLAISSSASPDSPNGTDSTLFRNKKRLAELISSCVAENALPGKPLKPSTQATLGALVKNQIGFLPSGKTIGPLRADTETVDRMQYALSRKDDVHILYRHIIEKCTGESDSALAISDIIRIPSDGEVTAKLRIPLQALYTPFGWETYIWPHIVTSTAHYTEIGTWVFGPYSSVNSDADEKSAAVKERLLSLYFDDVKEQWLKTLSSFSIAPFETLEDAEMKLRKLSGRQSPAQLLLATLTEWVDRFAVNDSSLARRPPLTDFRTGMVFLRELSEVRYPEYQELLMQVADGCSESLSGRSLATVFTNRNDDPLKACFTHVNNNVLRDLDEASVACVKQLFRAPVDNLATVLKPRLPEELNKLWRRHIYDRYDLTLHKRYPVLDSPNAQEASLNDVMDFFQPVNGYIDQFTRQYLSGWLSANNASPIPVTFTKNSLGCIKKADQIVELFYRGETLRTWDVTIKPSGSGVTSVIVNPENRRPDTVYNKGVLLKWPSREHALNGNITFVTSGQKYPYTFKGDWALMRMLNSGAKFKGTNYVSPFSATLSQSSNGKNFSMNVEVTVSATIHPFCMNPFSGFFVPEKLIEE